MFTNQQAKFFAYELTRLNKNNNLGGLSQALLDAQVDLNPHQVEAASFAIASPLSKGVLLADEVGLGKTIEAGIVLCQYWAERKRHLIVICPASLREQWKIELEEKFNLPSVIFDSKNFAPSLLSLQDKIVIISYNFAARISDDLVQIPWNLCVLDEAHKLRNVYKENNKIGRAIEFALRDKRKLLLTATPLQNSLMELFGLTSLIDKQIFGNERSFKMQYTATSKDAELLKKRLSNFCKRTLRSQVTEYIRYTERKPITFPFVPSKEEQILYEGVSGFLRKESTYALPVKQKHLTSLILFKLLASSSNAIYGTFQTMLARLEKLKKGQDTSEQDEFLEELIAEANIDEESTFLDEDICSEDKPAINYEKLDKEIEEIKTYLHLAETIKEDSKTIELTKALTIGFQKMEEMGANRKALIFTESKRTQKYLSDYLSANGYDGKIVLFHGGNKVQRSELIDQFKDSAEIMIATEAGAEGLNMQFCSLLINYDLPWNPQRVEQRIGRCHRYGQKHDVVVVNFVNKKNPADERVFELLNEKFKLFEGVFGASDEILGAIEDNVDFEKKILSIYQTCRTAEEIDKAFNDLQKEMETVIESQMQKTKLKLLSEFDADVHKRLKVNLDLTKMQLNEKQKMFWKMANAILGNDGIFDDGDYSFTLTNAALGKPQKYYFITQDDKHADLDSSLVLRLSHPLGEYAIKTAKNAKIGFDEILFDLSSNNKKQSYLQSLKEKNVSGLCSCHLMTIDSFETEEYLVLSGIDNRQQPVSAETLSAILNLEAISNTPCSEEKSLVQDVFRKIQEKNLQEAITVSENQNMTFFREESEKIDRYIEDKLYGVEKELKDVKAKIKTLTREERSADSLDRKVALQEEISSLERKKRRLRQNIFDVEDEIAEEREKLIEILQKKLKSTITTKHLFTFKWKLQ